MAKDYDAFAELFRAAWKRLSKIFSLLGGAARRLSLVGSAMRYRRSPYYRATRRPYKQLVRSKGAHGEYLLYDRLRREKGKWLFGVYLPKKGEKTEIDAILLSPKGVFVFESKNFSGQVYGHKDRVRWTQIVKTGNGIVKQRFFNPLMQNAAHAAALREQIGAETPVFAAVVFGRNCTLNIAEDEYDKNMLMTVRETRRFLSSMPKGALSGKDIDRLYAQLEPFTHVSYDEKMRHIAITRDKNR